MTAGRDEARPIERLGEPSAIPEGLTTDLSGAVTQVGVGEALLGMFLLALCLFCWLWAGILARARGGSPLWWGVAGFLLGPLGVALAYRMRLNWDAIDRERLRSGEMRICPGCRSVTPADSVNCRRCGELFDDPANPPAGAPISDDPWPQPPEALPYLGPERRVAGEGVSSSAIAYARLRTSCSPLYPSMQQERWYPVLDRTEEAGGSVSRADYVRLDMGEIASVRRAHLEIRQDLRTRRWAKAAAT